MVKAVIKACRLLQILSAKRQVHLAELAKESQLPISTVHSLLESLIEGGLLRKLGQRGVYTREHKPRYTIGYAAQRGDEDEFARDVHQGLLRAAKRANIQLVEVDNEYRARRALDMAERLIRAHVDLALEFQT